MAKGSIFHLLPGADRCDWTPAYAAKPGVAKVSDVEGVTLHLPLVQ